jgi:beta-1,4-mannosyl-glycoprotein beta-1,4-N-acetylglucosaminyltransferase
VKCILILFSFVCLCATSYCKIYDCFPFFNELELLQVRLAELNDHVDHFVLVESVETQRGDLKPLYFQENKHLFEKYLDKIIHIVVQDRVQTNNIVDHRGFVWDRENFQRECITRGLQQCDDLDIILISDLDEIPRAASIEKVKRLLYRNKRHWTTTPRGVVLGMPLYIFQINRRANMHGGKWAGTVATLYKNVKRKGIQYFRANRCGFSVIRNAGWHFTWMGGKDMIRQKFLSVVEGKSKEEVRELSEKKIQDIIKLHPVIIPIDSPYPNDFPKYIRDNIDYFNFIGFIAE